MKIQEKPDYLIFADSAKKGENTDFPDINRGWGITIEQTASKPPMEWMNGAFNRIDKNMLYLLQQGVPEWSELVTYPVNAIIKYNGVLYTSIAENDNAKPSTNTTKWRKLQADDFNALPALKKMNGDIPTYEVGVNTDFKDGLKSGGEDVLTKADLPIGMPLPWPTITPPSGWLKCNGAVFDKTLYPKLGDVYPSGFLPDLRGEFIRGFDDGRGVDTDREILIEQGDAIRNLTGSMQFHEMIGGVPSSGVFCVTSNLSAPRSHRVTGPGYSPTIKFDASMQVPTAEENRPRNIAFLYILKAE